MINITKQEDCCGCYACANVCPQNCIDMTQDTEGFFYPKVDMEKCTDCGLCEKVCPLIHSPKPHEKTSVYAAYSTDETRKTSASGGMFPLLAQQVIAQNGVVFGAKFNDAFDVVHGFTESNDGIAVFQGSKYAQSCIGETFAEAKRFLKSGRQVLFSGTPCQIGGLKTYLNKEYDNLICVDLICYGIPSPMVWQKYLQTLRENRNVKAVNFRDKRTSFKAYSLSAAFDDGSEYVGSKDKDLFLKGFVKNVFLRPSCYACGFKGIDRPSDITLADFWGIGQVMPDMDDDKGISCVMVHSQKGDALWQSVVGQTVSQEAPVDAVEKYNEAAVQSVNRPQQRDAVFLDMQNMPFEKLMKRYCEDSLEQKANKQIRRVGAKVKRMLKR